MNKIVERLTLRDHFIIVEEESGNRYRLGDLIDLFSKAEYSFSVEVVEYQRLGEIASVFSSFYE